MLEVRIHAVSDEQTKRLMRRIKRFDLVAIQAPNSAEKNKAKTEREAVRKERDDLVANRLRVRDAGRFDIVADLDEDDPAQRPKQYFGRRLHAHDPEIATEVSVGKQESIVWVADRPFSIVKIEKSRHGHHGKKFKEVEGAPRNPFYRDFPAYGYKGKNEKKWYRLSSGPAKPKAIGQRYKITLKFGRKEVDPDLVCMD
jgi:hypothetical protein